MIFQNAPTALNRIVLAVIGRVIGEPHGQPRLLHKRHDALHELGASAMGLRPIIEGNHQRGDVPKAITDGLPPAHEAIDDTITRDFGGHPIQKQFIPARQADADRSDRRSGLEVMVSRLRGDAALPAPREGTNFDGCFRIDGDA